MSLSAVRLLSSVRVEDAILYGGAGGGVDGNPYRRAITVTEQSGNDLTDYQVRIDLNSSNFDFSKSTDDGSDIRITDESGNKLPFWIEKWDSLSEEAIIWVKVPSIPANTTITLYLCYGNTSLLSESNGENTFDFFDDFEGTSVDTSKWTSTGGTAVVNDSILSYNGDTTRFYSQQTFLYPIAFRSKNRIPNPNPGVYGHGKNIGIRTVYVRDGFELAWSSRDGTYQARFQNDGGQKGIILSEDFSDWYVLEILWPSTVYGAFFKDDTLLVESNTYIPDEDVPILFYEDGDDAIYADWVLIRKLTEPEPSVSIGEEETTTAGGNRARARIKEVVR